MVAGIPRQIVIEGRTGRLSVQQSASQRGETGVHPAPLPFLVEVFARDRFPEEIVEKAEAPIALDE
jgi:hypothetical protein